MVRYHLATCYRWLGDLAASEAELRRAQRTAISSPIGSEARALIIPLNLSLTLAMEGKAAEAESGLQEVKPSIEKISPGAPTQQGYFELVSGVCSLNRGDAANAEHRFRRALEWFERAVRPGHVYFADARRRLASALEAQGRIAEARAAAEDAVRIWAQNYAAGNPILEEARTYVRKLSQ